MKKYTNSVIALFICMLILTPSTVYAEELASMPTFSVIQPITGAALPNENLSASLVTRLNTYLADSLNNGNIDIQKFNDILSSGMVSENAFLQILFLSGTRLQSAFQNTVEHMTQSRQTAHIFLQELVVPPRPLSPKMRSLRMPILCQNIKGGFSSLRIPWHNCQMYPKCLSALA